MRVLIYLALLGMLLAGNASSSAAEEAAFGKWAASQENCAAPNGEGDTVTISEKEIFGLEWHCDIRDAFERKGYMIVDANCGAEGEEFDTMIKYRIAGSDLLFKFGNNKEETLLSCGKKVQAKASDAPVFKRCHMDFCSFSQLVSREVIGGSQDGVLYKIGSKGYGRKTSQEEYETVKPPEVFPDEVSYKWVFCSTTKPAVFFEFENPSGLQMHLLAPASPNFSGAETRSLQAYWATCHNIVVYEWEFTSKVADKADFMNYSKQAVSNIADFATLEEAYQFLGVKTLGGLQ